MSHSRLTLVWRWCDWDLGSLISALALVVAPYELHSGMHYCFAWIMVWCNMSECLMPGILNLQRQRRRSIKSFCTSGVNDIENSLFYCKEAVRHFVNALATVCPYTRIKADDVVLAWAQSLGGITGWCQLCVRWVHVGHALIRSLSACTAVFPCIFPWSFDVTIDVTYPMLSCEPDRWNHVGVNSKVHTYIGKIDMCLSIKQWERHTWARRSHQ